MPYGRLSSNGYYQASGESTPQAKLPDKYVSCLQPSSPLAANNPPAVEYEGDIRRAPIVNRRPRMRGMRTLYSRSMTPMPSLDVTVRSGVNVNNSDFNRKDMGPIRNGHFNDALYQAGYPGINLGLSFKVQTLPTQVTGPGHGIFMKRFVPSSTNRVNPLARPSGSPPDKPTSQ